MKIVDEFFIDTKKVIKMENDYDIPIYLAHTKQDDTIRLIALINTQFNNEYAPLMHLYAHLLFNNVIVGDETLKDITAIREYANKYNLYCNAYTGVDGIEIVVDVQKYQCEIEWLQHTTNFYLEKGIQLLYGLLFNRKYLSDELIEENVDIIKTEIATQKDELEQSEIAVYNLIYDNFIDFLGTSKDFYSLGIETIKEVIRDFDSKLIHKDYISIIIHSNLDIDNSIVELVDKSFNLSDSSFEKVINGTKSKYLNNNIMFNFDKEKTLMTKLPTLVYNCFFETKLELDNILELLTYKALLRYAICGIDYGINNFVKESKSMAYHYYKIDEYNIIYRNYFNELIKNNSNTIKFPLGFFIPLNRNIDLDLLCNKVLKFINNLTIDKQTYERTVRDFINTKYSFVLNYDIIARENIIKLIKATTNLTVEQITQKLNQTYNINDFSYNKLLEYLEYFKKNVQLFKIQGDKDELQ